MRLFITSLKPLFCFLLAISSANANCVDNPEELAQYIATFPREEYIICEVPGQGTFYVEPFKSDTIKNVLWSGQVWEPHVLSTIHQYAKPGTIVFDIGAHIGSALD